MVFAARASRTFITPGEVAGVLDALAATPLADDVPRSGPEAGSVWALPAA
ncbi:hypothetical protein B0H10DRAFT_1986957 [Mycena sp. CBHHK59/15]|nr:hypothetical protein B0H10DRAFT_1986957 [Mycena sp. CBHHK59/15]